MTIGHRLVRRFKSALAAQKPRPPEPSPEILAVLQNRQIAEQLQAAVQEMGWKLEIVPTLELAIARSSEFNTIILEQSAAEPDWRNAVSSFSKLPNQPAVLLLAERSGPNLRLDLTRAGGYCILSLPLRSNEIRSSVYAGWLLWSNHDMLRQLTK